MIDAARQDAFEPAGGARERVCSPNCYGSAVYLAALRIEHCACLRDVLSYFIYNLATNVTLSGSISREIDRHSGCLNPRLNGPVRTALSSISRYTVPFSY